jgi:hypothetical protein
MSGGGGVALWIVYAVVVVFMLAAMWKVFVKAGQPGWACIIPIYNVYIMLKIAGKPGWWLLLFLIPIVDFIVAILVYVGIAERFGKSGAFAAGMIFLPFIFIPILGFGSATYQG